MKERLILKLELFELFFVHFFGFGLINGNFLLALSIKITATALNKFSL